MGFGKSGLGIFAHLAHGRDARATKWLGRLAQARTRTRRPCYDLACGQDARATVRLMVKMPVLQSGLGISPKHADENTF